MNFHGVRARIFQKNISWTQCLDKQIANEMANYWYNQIEESKNSGPSSRSLIMSNNEAQIFIGNLIEVVKQKI